MVFAMFIIGIDIAKRSHMVRVIDSEGKTVCNPFTIRNNSSGCNALLERLRKSENHKSEFLFAMDQKTKKGLPSTVNGWQALSAIHSIR